MRAAQRLPTLNEAKLLAEAAGSEPNLLLWAVSKASDDPARAFRYFRNLNGMRVGQGELMAITGLGNVNRPSQIDIADGTDCDPQTFADFVADSTFGRLSGVLFGLAIHAQDCVSIISRSVESWAVNSGVASERELLKTIAKLRAEECTPVVCIADSNTRNYWAIVLDQNSVVSHAAADLFATAEEFAQWERIGWDVRSLNRSAP